MLVFKINVRCCLDTKNEIMKNIFWKRWKSWRRIKTIFHIWVWKKNLILKIIKNLFPTGRLSPLNSQHMVHWWRQKWKGCLMRKVGRVQRRKGGVAAHGRRERGLTGSKQSDYACVGTLWQHPKSPIISPSYSLHKNAWKCLPNLQNSLLFSIHSANSLVARPSNPSLYICIRIWIWRWQHSPNNPKRQSNWLIDRNGGPPTGLSLLPNWRRTCLLLPPHEAPG